MKLWSAIPDVSWLSWTSDLLGTVGVNNLPTVVNNQCDLSEVLILADDGMSDQVDDEGSNSSS